MLHKNEFSIQEQTRQNPRDRKKVFIFERIELGKRKTRSEILGLAAAQNRMSGEMSFSLVDLGVCLEGVSLSWYELWVKRFRGGRRYFNDNLINPKTVNQTLFYSALTPSQPPQLGSFFSPFISIISIIWNKYLLFRLFPRHWHFSGYITTARLTLSPRNQSFEN